MNTRIYEYLMAVAEYKNISQAAQQCFISQPALTQHIKKLEKQLGTPVFEKKESIWFPPGRAKSFSLPPDACLRLNRKPWSI